MDSFVQSACCGKSRPDKDGCQYESTPRLNDADCGLCMEPLRKARCVPMNCVEKVCAIRPQDYYVPSPYKLDDSTTYKTNFFPRVLEKQSSFRPGMHYLKGTGTFGGPSEYNYSYVPYHVPPFKKANWAGIGEYKEPVGSVNGVSTYRASYQPLLVCTRTEMFRPQGYRGPRSTPMDFRTSYKMNFVEHDHEKLCSLKPQQDCAGRDLPTFTGMSIMKSTYVAQPCHTKARTAKPKHRVRRLDYEFEKESTYGGSYRPYVFHKCDNGPKRNCYIFKDLQIKN